jgi:predicted alpha/beta-fold hydrolase
MKKVLLFYLTWCSFSYFRKASALNITYNHKKLNHILDMNPSLGHKIYYPSFFFSSGHIQTILLTIMNSLAEKFGKYTIKFYSKTRKIIKAKDGENIYVDFFNKSKKIDTEENFSNFDFLKEFNDSKIIVLIPGACGCSGVFYLTDLMKRFLAENFKCITINHRGVLEYKLLGRTLYHIGYTQDVEEVFDFLKANIKGSEFYLMGVSLGGNIVTKYLGELGDRARDYNIQGGVSLCGVLNLDKHKKLVETDSLTKFYSKRVCANFKAIFDKNKEELLSHMGKEEREDVLARLEKAALLTEYYREYLGKSFGFDDEEVFSKHASGYYYVRNIKVPFLCIFAEDDPIVPVDSLDGSGFEENENFVLAVTKFGGHCGFFKGFFLKRWIHGPIIDFVRDLSHDNNLKH